MDIGYTRLGTNPCLHPLIAVLEEAKLVAGFWLRPGNSSCANSVVAFMTELLSYLPSFIHLRVVHPDSGLRDLIPGERSAHPTFQAS